MFALWLLFYLVENFHRFSEKFVFSDEIEKDDKNIINLNRHDA